MRLYPPRPCPIRLRFYPTANPFFPCHLLPLCLSSPFLIPELAGGGTTEVYRDTFIYAGKRQGAAVLRCSVLCFATRIRWSSAGLLTNSPQPMFGGSGRRAWVPTRRLFGRVTPRPALHDVFRHRRQRPVRGALLGGVPWCHAPQLLSGPVMSSIGGVQGLLMPPPPFSSSPLP